MTESDDPTAIRSIAVRGDDLAAALEAEMRSGGDAVLRITPPFSGRMRARLHVPGDDTYDDPTPIHVGPRELVADPPAYPEPAETEDALRAEPGVEYTRDRHRERHREAVAAWREGVRECVVDDVALATEGGEHRVAVAVL